MGRKHHDTSTPADDSWTDTIAHNRRFPKRGASKRSSTGNSSGGSTFNVQSILGTYAVKCPVLEKAHEKHKAAEAVGGSSPVESRRRGSISDVQMMFEVHGLVQRKRKRDNEKKRDCDDEEEEMEDVEALEGSFDFGVVKGMCLIGGSRRGLREVVRTVEEDEENDNGEEEKEDERKPGDYPRVYQPDDEDEDVLTEDNNDDDENALPISPSRNRPLFEKNTFRQPKFFFEWRGHDLLASENVSRGPRSDCMGHLEFSSNACKDFKGTFSSERWGENVAFEGWKVRNKAVECPYAWGQFDVA